SAELSVCCSGPLPQKQVNGRLTLDGVRFDAIVPAAIAGAIGARVDAAARFSATGNSLESVVAAMAAEGSYTLADLSIAGLDPGAFDAIDSFEAVLDMEPASVSALVTDRLDDATFTADSVTGEFTVAAGVLRSPNVAIEGAAARLFGG